MCIRDRRYTDLPFLIALEAQDDGSYAAGKFVVAGDLSPSVVSEATSENAMWKPVLLDGRTDAVAVPRGSVGFRYGDEGLGQWNLDLGDIEPVLSVLDTREGEVLVRFPRFDAPDGTVAFETRGVPIRRVGDRVVTTVLDLSVSYTHLDVYKRQARAASRSWTPWPRRRPGSPSWRA